LYLSKLNNYADKSTGKKVRGKKVREKSTGEKVREKSTGKKVGEKSTGEKYGKKSRGKSFPVKRPDERAGNLNFRSKGRETRSQLPVKRAGYPVAHPWGNFDHVTSSLRVRPLPVAPPPRSTTTNDT